MKKSDIFLGMHCERCGDAILNEFDDYAVLKIRYLHVDERGDPQLNAKKQMHICQRCACFITTRVPTFTDFN